MGSVILVCEAGETGEWERVLIEDLVNLNCPDLAVETRGASGHGGIRAVAEAFRVHEGIASGYVMDRDYMSDAWRDRELDRARGYVWSRHEIENYLVEPAVVVRAVARLKASYDDQPGGRPRWAEQLPEDPAVVAEALRRAAAAMVPVEAAKFALQDLVDELHAVGRVQVRLDVVCPGLSVAGCVQRIGDECQRLREEATRLAGCLALAPSAAEGRYRRVLADIGDDAAIGAGRHLLAYKGKSLLSALRDWLHQDFGAPLTEDRLRDELAKALRLVYGDTPGLFRPDDFLILANRLRALARLPAVGGGAT